MNLQQNMLDLINDDGSNEIMKSQPVSAMFWNLQSPSIERVKPQFEYMMKSNCNVFILTELRHGKSLEYLKFKFEENGFRFHLNASSKIERYVTAIATRNFKVISMSILENIETSRIVGVDLCVELGCVSIMGAYAPPYAGKYSNDDDIFNKRKFHGAIEELLENYLSESSNRLVFGGDLNILRSSNNKTYPDYSMWYCNYEKLLNLNLVDAYYNCNSKNSDDYSWFDRYGNGFRLDHCFVDTRLVQSIRSCTLEHEPRINGLSDHSAIIINLFEN